MSRCLAAAILALACAAFTGAQTPSPRPFGFTRNGAVNQLRLERQFLALPQSGRIRDAHAFLSAKPHIAGSPRDRELADWTASAFTDAGLTGVEISTHEVLLP